MIQNQQVNKMEKRLREMAARYVSSHCSEGAKRMAKRVLLLEKAYRYYRAVDCLTSWIVWHIGQTGKIMGDKQMACNQKAKQYRTKAAELYRQAESI